jgi:hypothetical protein
MTFPSPDEATVPCELNELLGHVNTDGCFGLDVTRAQVKTSSAIFQQTAESTQRLPP